MKIYEIYRCPSCGDELSVYEIEPFSITDVGVDRREDTGNYFCSECDRDYEPVEVVSIKEAREALIEELEKARQAHIRPGSIQGNLFGDLHDKDHSKANLAEQRMISGVQVVAITDINSALDRVLPLSDKE